MNKIELLGMKEINAFLAITQNMNFRVELYNPATKHRVSAKSMLGVLLASTEWGDNVWVDADEDIYSKIEKFIAISDGDGINIHE